MRILSSCIAILLTVASVSSAEPEGFDDAIIVTATRRESSWFELPSAARSIDEEVLARRRAPRSLPEALADEPSVMVQKTANGQSSPYIRGFTGFRTLLLVDGIRLNNSVFREGPNQYWGTVDSMTVSRLELVGGPGSVLFGSDAVGGTVNALLRSAPEGLEDLRAGGRFYGRIAGAERSGTGRLEAWVAEPGGLRALAGLTLRAHGDLENGRHGGTTENSGYHEDMADLRLDFAITEDLDVTLAWQRARLDDVPRTHSTRFGESWRGTSVGTDLRRDYSQDRDLVFVRATYAPDGAFFDRLEVTLSWQNMGEVQDRVRSSGQRDLSGFDVDTYGVATQVESDTCVGALTAGFEWYHDDVASDRRRIEPDGSVREFVQGPVAGDATYDLLGLYVQDEIEATEWLTLVGGVRFTHAAAHAEKVEDPVTGEETSLDDRWSNVVGSLRAVLRPHERWRVFGGISQGFRAPNLSDLTRLDSARSGEIETPSPDLDPERYLSFELGFRTEQEGWRFDVNAHHTAMWDLITRYPTGREIDGELEVQKDNVGDGWVQGVEARLTVDLTEEWSLYGGIALLRGEADVYPTSERKKERETLSRLAPAQGLLGVRWTQVSGRFWAEAQGRFADAQNDLSTRDEGDTQRIPPGGTPGWSVFHLRGGVEIAEGIHAFAGLENVFDLDYRIHGSGQNMPGRNLILGFDLKY